MSEPESLDELRRDLDRIDEKLHDLLIERARVVGAVAKVKRRDSDRGLPIRPAREAQMMRALLGRHSGDLPASIVYRIWREILAATPWLQSPFTVVTHAPENDPEFRDLCRNYYGSAVPLETLASAADVLARVVADEAAIGILALDDTGDELPWWAMLARLRQDSESPEAVPQVVARLPFFEETPGNEAYAIAQLTLEESGDDQTLAVVSGSARPETDEVTLISECSLADSWHGLIRLPGFITAREGATIIGCFASPFVAD